MAKAKKSNRVTVYSNGIADFQREFELQGKGEPTEVNIPINKSHIGDFIGTLNIFGKAELVAPPTYRPANENDNRLVLEQGDDVWRSLLKQLTGSNIKYTEGNDQTWKRGRVIGIDTEEKATNGEAVNIYRLTCYGEDGIVSIPLTQINKLDFEDDEIKREVDKALKRSAEQIRPNSSQVSMSLAGDSAILQYAIPCAAWKLSYRLRQIKDTYTFEAMAHVDNNTEEDWTDTVVAVCTGNPHTFETDLAEAKTPQRNKVNVVSERAEGGQTVRRAAKMAVRSAGSRSMAMGYTSDDAEYSSESFADADAEGFGGPQIACSLESVSGGAAEQVQAEEIGDFTRFECKESMYIAAGHSATFPVFTATLEESQSVLYFNGTNPERAFRAIKFKNETEHTFNRGVCSFFQDGAYSGQSVLSAVKPSEEQFAIYATDTTAKFLVKGGRTKQRATGLKVSDGVSITTLDNKRTTDYNISATEPAKVVIDHQVAFGDDTKVTATLGGEEVPASAKTDNGVRFEFDATQGDQAFIVQETAITVQEIRLGNFRNLANNVIVTEGRVEDNADLQALFEIQQEIDQVGRDLREQQQLIEQADDNQETLRANAAADEDNKTYRKLLEEAFNDQRAAQAKVAELTNQQEALQQKLQSALQELRLAWEE